MSIVISLPGKRFKRLNNPIARKDMKTELKTEEKCLENKKSVAPFDRVTL